MPNPFLAADVGFIRLCGHRGHNLTAPENTFAAFRAAHELGATSLEIDTVLKRILHRFDEIALTEQALIDQQVEGARIDRSA